MSPIVVLSTALTLDSGVQGRHPLAGLSGGIPILWNLLFEPAELPVASRPGARDARDIVVVTASKLVALERLERRTRWCCELLGSGVLAEYAALLAASLRSTAGEYVTMDLAHMAAQRAPGEFVEEYREVLESIADGRLETRLGGRILAMSGYVSGRGFPPARLLLDVEHPPWQDSQDHARVIGASWTGSLAWERSGR